MKQLIVMDQLWHLVRAVAVQLSAAALAAAVSVRGSCGSTSAARGSYGRSCSAGSAGCSSSAKAHVLST